MFSESYKFLPMFSGSYVPHSPIFPESFIFSSLCIQNLLFLVSCFLLSSGPTVLFEKPRVMCFQGVLFLGLLGCPVPREYHAPSIWSYISMLLQSFVLSPWKKKTLIYFIPKTHTYWYYISSKWKKSKICSIKICHLTLGNPMSSTIIHRSSTITSP